MILLLLACSTAPEAPEGMQGLQEALGHWKKAEQFRQEGKLESALQSLEKALSADAQSPELWLSAAHVLAGLDQLENAIRYAGRAIKLRPEWHDAYYDRACWLSLSGQVEKAAKDLRFALGKGGIDLLTAAADSDLDAVRSDPRFSDLLPEKALPAEVSADEKAYFLASEWTINFRFLNRHNQTVELDFLGEVGFPALLLRAVEDITPQSGVNAHSVQFVFRVSGAGEGTVGPWSIASGGLSRSLAPVSFRFRAPPNRPVEEAAPLASGAFSIPSTLFAAMPMHEPLRQGETVLVKTLAGERVEWRAPDAVQYELRLEGQTEWVGWLGSLPGDSELRILRGRKAIWSGRL
jgi:hypothetical protein